MNDIPLVSVIMPVYNGQEFLRDSIDSILNQTFKDFEFIILNDGSSDKTEEIILSYNDPRILYIKNSENLQIVKTLNKGISAAKGKYIARMDADDISLPKRLSTQVRFMEENPEIGVCGSWLRTFGETNDVWKMPISHDEIFITLLFHSCIMHPTAFIRNEVIVESPMAYNSSFNKAEDYELWTRLVFITRFANIPEVLLEYRVFDMESFRINYKIEQEKISKEIKIKFLKKIGLDCKESELKVHFELSEYKKDLSLMNFISLIDWILKIKKKLYASEYVVDKKIISNVLVKKIYPDISNIESEISLSIFYKELSKLADRHCFLIIIRIFCKRLYRLFLK